MGNYYGASTRPNLKVFMVAMRTPDGCSVCRLHHVASLGEAIARTTRELPDCTLIREWTKGEDSMSPDEADQCREELGLRLLHPRVEKRIDLSVLDLY